MLISDAHMYHHHHYHHQGRQTIAFLFLQSIIIAVSFFGKTKCLMYLLHLSFGYRIKCFGETYKQECCLKNFLHILLQWFNDSSESEKLLIDFSFLNFWLDMIKKLSIRNWAIGLINRVFGNGSGDLGSILGQVRPKTQKMVLDAALLNTQHYKVQIKGKVEQSQERSHALPYILV